VFAGLLIGMFANSVLQIQFACFGAGIMKL